MNAVVKSVVLLAFVMHLAICSAQHERDYLFRGVMRNDRTRDMLYAGKQLGPNMHLESPSKAYMVIMRRDGNLAVSTNQGMGVEGYVLWESGTNSSTASSVNLVLGDRNMVIYRDGKVEWASGTNCGNGPVSARLQDDGNFVIYDADNMPLWASGTEGGQVNEDGRGHKFGCAASNIIMETLVSRAA